MCVWTLYYVWKKCDCIFQFIACTFIVARRWTWIRRQRTHIPFLRKEWRKKTKNVIIIFQYIDSLSRALSIDGFSIAFLLSDMDWLSWNERCPGNIMFAWLGFTHELPILSLYCPTQFYWFRCNRLAPSDILKYTQTHSSFTEPHHFKMMNRICVNFLWELGLIIDRETWTIYSVLVNEKI